VDLVPLHCAAPFIASDVAGGALFSTRFLPFELFPDQKKKKNHPPKQALFLWVTLGFFINFSFFSPHV